MPWKFQPRQSQTRPIPTRRASPRFRIRPSSQSRLFPRRTVARRILALVSEPVSGEVLKRAVGSERAETAEVLVVAPALNTRTRYLFSDVDPAIERAEEVEQETVERMGEAGIDAAGDTGESDPLLALQDALQTFEADQIVLFTHADEQALVDEARTRFDRPVEHVVVEG
jgi:hypothetical protein